MLGPTVYQREQPKETKLTVRTVIFYESWRRTDYSQSVNYTV